MFLYLIIIIIRTQKISKVINYYFIYKVQFISISLKSYKFFNNKFSLILLNKLFTDYNLYDFQSNYKII